MKPDDIVGHKTLYAHDGTLTHVPLRRDEAERLWAESERRDSERKAAMPTEQSAIQALFDAFLRLQDFGWKDAIYSPKDGTEFEVIECGSTGIHRCTYLGPWPKGSWWVVGDGDMWPSRPTLFRSIDQQGKEGAA